uniref:Uncharacterized protein n=1 Tax=Tanacetum cinerariifolium TaxID=118510 RepID=A0A6L2LD25_TANCI|nr:hypothetical protein [Tanacetum cinerariifolium]
MGRLGRSHGYYSYIKDSKADKTYYDFSKRRVPPRKTRKYKKVGSPSRKLSPIKEAEPVKKGKRVKRSAKKSTTASTAGVAIRDTSGVSVSKKNALAKADRSKGIEILSNVALSKAAQLMDAIKRSKQDFNISQASGSGDGIDFESGVPNEQQCKTSGDSEDDNDDDSDADSKGDDDKADSDDDEHDEEYESDDDYENVFEEEDVDMYKDVDVKSLGADHKKEREGYEETTDANQNTKSSKQSSSVSSDFASKFLNLENIPPAIDEVASMINVKNHQEESSTQEPSLFTVPETTILETSISHATTLVDDFLSTRIRYATRTALDSYTKDFQKKAQEEKKLYIDVVEKLVKVIIKLEVKSLLPQILPNEVSDFATPMIHSTINESLENVVLAKSSSQPKSTYEATESLIEFELKMILLDKMEISESYKTTPEHKHLYEGLVRSYNLDKDLFSSYENVYSLKRDRDDKDKDEDPSPQKWISNIAKTSQPHRMFDELMSTPIYFSAYVMHNLKIDNLTQEILNNPKGHEYPFDLSKPLPLIEAQGHQVVPADYFFNNDLEYLKGRSSSRKYTTSTTKTKAAKYDKFEGIKDMILTLWSPVKKRIIALTHVKVMKWYDYGYLEEIIISREDQTLHKFKEDDFPRLNLRGIEDLLLLLRMEDLQLGVKSYQKKLNLTKPETFRSDIFKMTPYSSYKNPQGIIYQDQFKRNRLMRLDELYKLCDGTLTFVRRLLHDIANNLRMDYLPKRRWSNLDRKRSRIMIKAIDQQLFERRLMRNLEKFVSGREYREDFGLLERTI